MHRRRTRSTAALVFAATAAGATARYGQSCVLLTWVLTVGALGLIVGVGLWYVAGGEIARHGRDSGADRTMRRHLTCVEM
jgi:hypothetical protein